MIAIPQILDVAATYKKSSKQLKKSGEELDSILVLHGDKTPSLVALATHSWKNNTVFAEEREAIISGAVARWKSGWGKEKKI